MSGIFDSDIDLILLIKLNNTGFQQLIRVEDEDSSGKARQVRPPGRYVTEEAHLRPWKAKSSTEINCGI
jgi:hypothetical protein